MWFQEAEGLPVPHMPRQPVPSAAWLQLAHQDSRAQPRHVPVQRLTNQRLPGVAAWVPQLCCHHCLQAWPRGTLFSPNVTPTVTGHRPPVL